MIRRGHDDSGLSIVEVILAVTILMTVGVVLLNGLVNGNNLSRKVADNSVQIGNLNLAADAITAAQFRGCTGTTDSWNPYAGVTLPSGVEILQVYGVTRTQQWAKCSNSLWQGQPTTLQRVVLRTTIANDANSKKIRKFVLKTFPATTGAYGFNASVSPTSLKIGPYPGPSDLLQGSATLNSSLGSTSVCYYPLFSDVYDREPVGFTPTLQANPCGSAMVTVDARTTTRAGSFYFDYGAYDHSTGNLGRPVGLNVIIKAPLEVTVEPAICSSFASTPCTIIIKPVADTGTTSGARFRNNNVTTAVTGWSGTTSPGATASDIVRLSSVTSTQITLIVSYGLTSGSGLTQLCNSVRISGARPYQLNTRIDIALEDAGYPSRTLNFSMPVSC